MRLFALRLAACAWLVAFFTSSNLHSSENEKAGDAPQHNLFHDSTMGKLPMKTALSTFHAFRVKILALLAVLAIGGAALSLGGCTCADANGNQIDCPYAAQGYY